jgi:hypothetical protein
MLARNSCFEGALAVDSGCETVPGWVFYMKAEAKGVWRRDIWGTSPRRHAGTRGRAMQLDRTLVT